MTKTQSRPKRRTCRYVQVLTTTPNQSLAQRIARRLVADRLAACVQTSGPIRSTYRWQGRIEHAQEWLCVIKTRARCYRKVERVIRELHSYQVPEIIVLPVQGGSRDYIAWLDETVA